MQREQQIHNFARFWVLFKRLPYHDDPLRHEMVARASAGQTDDLKLLTPQEYASLCHHLEMLVGEDQRAEQAAMATKRLRSGALKRMQSLGVNTTDWAQVDRFCQMPKIAGKRFARLDDNELRALIRKLEAVRSHLREPPAAQKQTVRVRVAHTTSNKMS